MLYSELNKLKYSYINTLTMLELERSLFTTSSFYGHTNMNLVENRISQCDVQLTNSNIPHSTINSTTTNWSNTKLPVLNDFNRIEYNLKALDIPNKFTKKQWIELQPFDYNDANRWERQSEILLHLVTNIQHNWKRCGNYKCGG